MCPKSKNKFVGEEHSFVDREDILKELESYKRSVLSKKGTCVFLKGETGIGKTSVAEEFLKGCKKSGFEVLRGRCLHYESTEPYLPFYEALGKYLKDEEEEDQVGSTFMGPPAISTSSSTTPMGFISAEQNEEEVHDEISFSDQQDMMFTRIKDLLRDISKKRPVIFFMDDLQWIDESSAQLLHHLARNISGEQIFLLGAFRPEELQHEEKKLPLKDTLDRMKEKKLVEIGEIPRLDQTSVSKMIKENIPYEDPPEEFLWALYRESEGNPFYVMEILNTMMQEGVIDSDSLSRDAQGCFFHITIPSSIRDLTIRKLEGLEKDEKKVLKFASFLGTKFNFQLLEKVLEMDVTHLLDVIDSLKEQGLIEELEETEEELYRFHHLQTRTVLYEEMGPSRKRVSHRRIGHILEEFYKDELAEHYFELSRHFFEGRDYEKAYEYSKKAGERALQGVDISTAIDHFERALESIRKRKDVEDTRRDEYELLKKIGDLYFDRGDWESSKKIYTKMVKRGKEIKARKMEVVGLMNLGHVYKNMSDFEKAEGYFEKALEISKELGYIEGIAQCNRGLGYICWREGEFERAKEHYQKGIAKAKEADDDKELALNYLNLAPVYSHKGEYDKAIDHFKKSLPPLEARNLYRQLARVNNNLGDQYMKKEEWDKAIDYFDKSIEYSKMIDNKRTMCWGSFNAAEAYTRKGDIKRAYEYLGGIEELMEDMGDELGLAAVHHTKGLIHQKEGHIDKAIERYKSALSAIETLDVPFNKAEHGLDLGLAYKEKGEYEKARDQIEKSYETFKEIGASDKFVEKARDALKELSKKSNHV